MPPRPLRERKAFEMLTLMSADEVDLFRHFLAHPIGGESIGNGVLEFFDAARSLSVWNSDIDKVEFMERSGLSMNDGGFDKICSNLKKALVRFSSATLFMKTPLLHGPLALSYYRDRGMTTHNLSIMAKDEIRSLDSDYEREERYHLTRMNMNLTLAEKMVSRSTRPEERNLGDLHVDCDASFAITKLRLLCATVNQYLIYGGEPPRESDQMFIQVFKSMYPQMPLLARLFFHVLHIILGQDESSHLAQFKELLQEWQERFAQIVNRRKREDRSYIGTDTIAKELNDYVQNYYLRRLNTYGDLETLPILYQLYMDAFDKESPLTQGLLEPDKFVNIISIACRMKKIDEAKRLLFQYRGKLSGVIDENFIEFNRVQIKYYDQKTSEGYEDVLQRLEKLKDDTGFINKDLTTGLRMRCLLLKVLYEYYSVTNPATNRKKWDELDDKLRFLLRAFEAYISRREVSMPKRLRYENFRRSVARLLTIRNDEVFQRKNKAKELLSDLKSSSNLPDKEWFVQQATILAEQQF